MALALKFNPLAILLLSLLMCNVALAQPADESSSPIRVYPLKFAKVVEARDTILQMTSNSNSIRTTADIRTNSLIVSGNSNAQEYVASLLKIIDAPPVEAVENVPSILFESIRLPKDVDPELMERVAATALAGSRNVRMELVPDLGTLFVTGVESDIQRVKEVVDQIALSAPKQLDGDAFVSITLVVDGQQLVPDSKEGLKTPNSSVLSVIGKANDAGLVDLAEPLVAAKVVNRVKLVDRKIMERLKDQSRPSFTNFSQTSDSVFGLNAKGYLALEGEKCLLDADLTVQVSKVGDARDSNLNANIELPMGHPVMMSVSTILGFDSVVIVEVKKAD